MWVSIDGWFVWGRIILSGPTSSFEAEAAVRRLHYNAVIFVIFFQLLVPPRVRRMIMREWSGPEIWVPYRSIIRVISFRSGLWLLMAGQVDLLMSPRQVLVKFW